MTPGRRLALATALAAGGLAAWVAFCGLLLLSTLDPNERDALVSLLAPRAPLLLLAAVAGMALLAGGLRAWLRPWVQGPERLLEQARLQLAGPGTPPVEPQGPPPLRRLAEALNAFAARRDALLADLDARVAQAARGLEEERSRLAALMSELTQSVVVCTLDGRIVLYNARARLLLGELSGAPEVAGGAEIVGIGRSIYAVFDRQRVAHALEVIERGLARGEPAPVAQFATVTAEGRLLRAQVAPVREHPGSEGIAGFVLMLEDVTRGFEEDSLRDQLLHGMAERQRVSLAHLESGLEALSRAADPAGRESEIARLRAELGAMRRRLGESAAHIAEVLRPRWPTQEMLGSDLLSAAAGRIEALCGRPVAAQALDDGLWLDVESFTLSQALAHLALRLVEEKSVRSLQLRLRRAGAQAQLELVFSGPGMSAETVAHWESEPMRSGGASPLSVREVVQRHRGELSFGRDVPRQEAWFRFVLPLAGVGVEPREPAARAPQAWDFDLFAAPLERAADEDAPLASLAFTVFDTETTGLEPSRGDEIIQIGAVRVVHGKLLAQEAFEQLVDPGRGIPAASIPIHGITPAMVQGQPRIEQVLPTFHAYAQDTVLVAHNAAFDMRFLQLLQPRTGIEFRQPVLDTMLLSALVHPSQASHRLEAIAERFGLAVQGRHTALGDAMLTAQILLRLLPLLEAMGIRTLRQAREASQKTWRARIRY